MVIPLLPTINAVFNASSGVCLVLGLRARRREDYKRHGFLMTAALVLSAAFLVGYVYFHNFAGVEDRKYTGPDGLRIPYLVMLASHIILAAVNLPLILYAFWLGRRNERARHERVTRFAWPIWMYVSVTGVMIYLVLYVWAPGFVE